MMPKERRVYRLSPSQFSAETIAVTFAKTSRSPEPFDVIAAELDAEKSSQFSEKWIVGYGHSSVAEHAVLHLALENVSRLAIETIEGNRLASYTEKSTRYQEWDPKAYVVPPEIQGSVLEGTYCDVADHLFGSYAEALQVLKPWSEARTKRRANESEKAWANRARVQAVDIARFLLPTAAMANVGITMNARVLEYAIKKMLSSDLAEVRQIGEEVKTVATQELPTLVKYAQPIAYMQGLQERSRKFSAEIDTLPDDAWCRLSSFDPDGENRVLAAVLYRFGDDSYQVCLDQVANMDTNSRKDLVDLLFDDMGDFDVPLRELEYSQYSFDLIMDQGAWFEFKRHRMMTQTIQQLGPGLGYAMPRGFVEAGFESQYRRAMEKAAEAFISLEAKQKGLGSYLIPNAFNRRVLCQVNLRELFHFIKLRCANNAHFSIRRVGRGMAEALLEVHPTLAGKLRIDDKESSESIAKEQFSGLAEKAL